MHGRLTIGPSIAGTVQPIARFRSGGSMPATQRMVLLTWVVCVCVGTRACLWFPARERFRVMCNRPMDTRTAPSRHLRSCHEPTTGRIGKQLLAFLSSPPSRLLSSARDDDDMTRRTPRREEPAFPHARLRCTVRRRWRVSLPPARRRLAMITCEPASALAGDVRYPPPPPPPPPQAASQAARDGI
jgi:hypothetical protein